MNPVIYSVRRHIRLVLVIGKDMIVVAHLGSNNYMRIVHVS